MDFYLHAVVFGGAIKYIESTKKLSITAELF